MSRVKSWLRKNAAEYIIITTVFFLSQAKQWTMVIIICLCTTVWALGLHTAAWCRLMWLTRKPRRLLRWWLGRKWYFVHRGGIEKVIITERRGRVWHATERHTWLDNKTSLINFTASHSTFYRTKDAAIKALVELRDYEVKGMREYHNRKGQGR